MENTIDRFNEKHSLIEKALSAASRFLKPVSELERSLSKQQDLLKSHHKLSVNIAQLQEVSDPLNKSGKSQARYNFNNGYWKRQSELALIDTKINKINESIKRVQEIINLEEESGDDGIFNIAFPETEDWDELTILDNVYIDSSTDTLFLDEYMRSESLSTIWSDLDWRELLSGVLIYLDTRKEEYIIIRDKVEKSYAQSLRLDIRREIRRFLKRLFRNTIDEEDILTSKTTNIFFRIKILLNNDNKTIYPIYRYAVN